MIIDGCVDFIPLIIAQGSTFYRPIAYVVDQCDLTNDDTLYPQDISGYTGIMNVYNTPSDTASPLITASTSNAGMIIDGPNGKIEIWIPASTIQATAPGCYYYDVYITSSTGLVERLFGGTFTVIQRGGQL